ncbi:Ig-like domain-containing protein [uncultured Treponema sp.]|mgnify:CR=1 FL=1|uniref:Ig-like domain-containing protein n=1 Tax=uncultured Treponema sp. TaxID=162155 RepID=UPI0025E27FAD|nr:Ig-like domain-containing protein [uncultured Treponema sp.]
MKKMWKALAVLTALALFGSAFTACKSDDDGDDDVSVTGVSLDKTSAELEVGGSLTLTATVAPDDAANKNVSWKSDKEEVATVKDGSVTAVAAGSAVITVTTEDGGKTATCNITVTENTSEDDDTGDINVEIKF